MKNILLFLFCALSLSSCMMVSTHKPLADLGRSGGCLYIPGYEVPGGAAVYKTPDGKLFVQGVLCGYERTGRPWVGPMLGETEQGKLRLVREGTRRHAFCEVEAVEWHGSEAAEPASILYPVAGKRFVATLPPGAKLCREKYVLSLPKQGEVDGRRCVMSPLSADGRAWYAYPLAAVGALVDIPATLVGNVLWGAGIIVYSPAIFYNLSQNQGEE